MARLLDQTAAGLKVEAERATMMQNAKTKQKEMQELHDKHDRDSMKGIEATRAEMRTQDYRTRRQKASRCVSASSSSVDNSMPNMRDTCLSRAARVQVN